LEEILRKTTVFSISEEDLLDEAGQEISIGFLAGGDVQAISMRSLPPQLFSDENPEEPNISCMESTLR